VRVINSLFYKHRQVMLLNIRTVRLKRAYRSCVYTVRPPGRTLTCVTFSTGAFGLFLIFLFFC